MRARNIVVYRTAVIILAATVAALVHAPDALAGRPAETAVTGRVVNGTAGAAVPDHFQVVLLTVDDDSGQIIETNATHADRDGSFTFENVLRSPGVSYRVVADYHDVAHVTYLDQESKLSGVEAKIYEVTDSAGDVVVASYALYVPTIDPQTRTAGVLGEVTFHNRGDRVFLGAGGEEPAAAGGPLWFSAPEGYADLSVQTDLPHGSLVRAADGWRMTHPVPPGTRSVMFTYTIGYEGDALEFALRLPAGAESLRVFLAEGLGNARLDGRTADNLVQAGDRMYVMAEGAGYEPGSQVAVRYEGLPVPSFLRRVSEALGGRAYVLVIAWLAAAGTLAMLGYVFVVQRRKERR
ncbi:MAG: hypothetical protein FJ313_06505, partial [Gemmatimonadetes bacterium]|nr:hypothetical protein [Gemmatimonadota bacterium]